KLTMLIISLPLLFLIASSLHLPLIWMRLGPALLMGVMYLLFIHTINFALASMAFFFDHVYSLNTTQNMVLWLLTGSVFPLDLLPSWTSRLLIRLPFSCGTYLPAGYISGRIGTEQFFQGFISLAIGLLLAAVLARFNWNRGLKNYTGTGA